MRQIKQKTNVTQIFNSNFGFTKKPLFTLLILFCFMGLLFAQTGTTQPVRPPGAGTEQNPFMIIELAHLRWLSERSAGADGWWVNENTRYHFLQMADIDATETANWNDGQGFEPIGHWFAYNEPSYYGGPMLGYWFLGTYDGGGFSITNLYMSRSVNDELIAGMFGRSSDSTIKNVRLINNNFNFPGNAYHSIGGIIGEIVNTTIENCIVTGSINVNGEGYIGGIVGAAWHTHAITNCHYRGNLTANVEFGIIGGIIGSVEGDYNVNTPITDCSTTGNITVIGDWMVVGGIIGEFVSHGSSANLKAVTNSFSTGNIHVSGEEVTVGGIAGIYSQSANMVNCFSRGDITGIGEYGANVGGIAGESPNSNITNCYSAGNIYGSSISNTNVGGILGWKSTGSSFVTNSHSSGNVTGIVTSPSGSCRVGGITGWYLGTQASGVIEFAYATGVISSSRNNAGGIVGVAANNNSPIRNSYWNSETSGVTAAAGETGNTFNSSNVGGRTTVQMKTMTTYTGWNFTTIWAIDPEINDGYPNLRGLNYDFGGIDPPPTFEAPVNLTAVLFGTIIELDWDLPPLANGGERVLSHFQVFRNGNQIAQDVTITQTFFTDNTVINNTAYSYHVVAVYENPDGVSEPSVATQIHTMFPPRELSYTFDEGNVVLNWLAPTGGGASGYNVFRDGALKTTTPITELTWSDTDTVEETEYTYEIKAVYGAGESEAIQIMLVTPKDDVQFNPPRLLEASIGDGFVRLTWHLPEVNPDIEDLELISFKVFRNTVMIAEDIKQTQYFDHAVMNQTEYTYFATAVYTYAGETVESAPSNEFTITTRFPAKNLIAISNRYDVILEWEAPAPFHKAVQEICSLRNSSQNYLLPSARHLYQGGDFMENGELIMDNGMQFLQGMPCNNYLQNTEIGYNVYRNDILLNTAPLSELTFTDEDTTPAAHYTYRVNAVYDGMESPPISVFIIIPLFSPATNLTASVERNTVELKWEEPETILEFEVLLGYNVYRDEILLTTEYVETLTFIDTNVPEGEYFYKVTVVYELGESEPVITPNPIIVSEGDIEGLPIFTELKGNYPNPFNPETIIQFNTAEKGNVSIEIYNIRGQKVRTLLNSLVERGEHTIVWNGKDDNGRALGSGVYFYQMKTDGFSEMRRMTLLK